MKDLAILQDLTHHAYLLIRANVDHLIRSLQKHHKIEKQGNPDFFHEKYESLGIDESRKIKEIHISKPFSAGKRIFIIETQSMTHEAQNALLKIFEEPHAQSHFFVLMPGLTSLLPTLRSRLYIIESQEREIETLTDAGKFLKLNLKDRIVYVDDIAKQISDEELTKSSAVDFLNALEIVLSENVEKNQKGLKALLKARDYIHDRSPSIKQLLEYVAMVV
jgi:DNA polymerase III delta prime subunit